MQRTPWVNVLVILLVIIAAIYLAQLLWAFLGGFSDIILLFVLAWLVAFTLAPLIERINGKPLPSAFIRANEKIFGPRVLSSLKRYRVSRMEAVGVVYLGLVLILFTLIGSLVPQSLAQLNILATQFPELATRAPEFARRGQDFLSGLGLRVDVEAALATALSSLQNVATPVLQNAVVILAGALSLIANLLVILLLSFFFALDGPRVLRAIFDLVPDDYDEEVRMLMITIDRAFGGFIRAQLVQAVLIGVGTGIVMALFRPEFVLVTGLFSGLFMLIPFVGPLLALFPPLMATLLADPGQLALVLVVLLIYQLAVVNLVMPKLLADALGLHPLVIFASLLIGIKIGGFWGAFFGIPVAGVIGTMALFFHRRRLKNIASQAEATAPSTGTAPAAPSPGSPGVATPARDLGKRA